MTLFLLILVTGIAGMGLLHTYVIYPWHMQRLALRPQEWEPLEEFPYAVILMAAYNEEATIQAKVQSIFRNHYPKSRLMVVVGTDACTDETDNLMLKLCQDYTGLHHRPFPSRTGKPGIINRLHKEYQHKIPREAILVLTDADAIFEDRTLAELVLPFSRPEVAGVQANILPPLAKRDALAKDPSTSGNVIAQETRYMQGEMTTKQGESRKGSVIGGYGALMAMRWARFEPSPDGLIVDDFFWFARLLQKPGSEVVFAQKAIARMPLEGSSAIQFRRKRRLGKGNLQNLWIFGSLIFQRQTAYCFVSHKVLRWLSPWLLVAFYAGCTASVTMHWKFRPEYGFALNWLMLSLILPAGFKALSIPMVFIDPLRQKIQLLEHFLRMNIALALGALDLFIKPSRHVWWDNRQSARR
jgi:cellulose synthase/poly-beta-1,6-N-acetylglucosamine synthase-like glycosyltransferase